MRRFSLALVTAVLLAACAQAGEPVADSEPSPDTPTAETPTAETPTAETTAPAEESDLDTVPVTLEGPDGPVRTFTAEVADDQASRREGLMHRESLPDDAGMLFVFPRDTDSGFWMKNTLIPLTIAFAEADGEIVAVLDMEPCEADPCPTYEPGARYRMALEVNEGALGDAEPGWRLVVGDGG